MYEQVHYYSKQAGVTENKRQFIRPTGNVLLAFFYHREYRSGEQADHTEQKARGRGWHMRKTGGVICTQRENKFDWWLICYHLGIPLS